MIFPKKMGYRRKREEKKERVNTELSKAHLQRIFLQQFDLGGPKTSDYIKYNLANNQSIIENRELKFSDLNFTGIDGKIWDDVQRWTDKYFEYFLSLGITKHLPKLNKDTKKVHHIKLEIRGLQQLIRFETPFKLIQYVTKTNDERVKVHKKVSDQTRNKFKNLLKSLSQTEKIINELANQSSPNRNDTLALYASEIEINEELKRQSKDLVGTQWDTEVTLLKSIDMLKEKYETLAKFRISHTRLFPLLLTPYFRAFKIQKTSDYDFMDAMITLLEIVGYHKSLYSQEVKDINKWREDATTLFSLSSKKIDPLEYT